ncbi:MAG: hypothetical protein ACE5R4_01025 [Armatimonadota bacterium]
MSRHGPQPARRLSGRRSGGVGRRLKALLIVLAALVLFSAVGRRALGTFVRGYITAQEVLVLERELEEAQREAARLQARRDEAGTQEGRRTEARGQLMLVKKGERVLTVANDEDVEEAVADIEGRQERSSSPQEVARRWLLSPKQDDPAGAASGP